MGITSKIFSDTLFVETSLRLCSGRPEFVQCMHFSLCLSMSIGRYECFIAWPSTG